MLTALDHPHDRGLQQIPTLVDSWQRSAAHGLAENDQPAFDPLASNELAAARDTSHQLMVFAEPVMHTLYDQIMDSESLVVLTDHKGLVLHSIGDDSFLERADKVALKPGVDWSEGRRGTNAVGTALAERMPTVVHGDQHYLSINRALTCSASPIHDAAGDVMGVLDVTGDSRGYSKHTIALVRMSARMIENNLFRRVYHGRLQLAFHARPEFLGTLVEGLLAFAPDGRVLSANQSALAQLGLSLSALRTHTALSLMGVSISYLIDRGERVLTEPISLAMMGAMKVYGLPILARPRRFGMPNTALISTQGEPFSTQAVETKPMEVKAGKDKLVSFADLNTGDAHIAQCIQRLERVAASEVSILIEGETGVGKEWFAQAIHQASSRRSKPFIAVNCASIPENLIESELFGYDEGAFTGARRKGYIGKILQANGGTLFLDEIGDMPLALQARLLRVLQERIVNPLGSSRQLMVDIKVVCATHARLREQIAARTFREDLYYRLNGLLVRVPALRDRSDLAVLIGNILTAEASVDWVIDEPVMALFLQHSWPGNLRQLRNVIRTAVALAGDTQRISEDCLPDDFFDGCQQAALVTSQNAEPLDMHELQIRHIEQAIAANRGNIAAAARQLGISRNTMYRRLQLVKTVTH
jgi:sigma-54 dependent transcriptional regulator, acetoin dehydrogenase operon transcriptional activator AcoR